MSSPSNLVTRVADAVQNRGRKASSGEPLFFDRHTLEQVIHEAIKKEIEPTSRSIAEADGRSPQGEDKGSSKEGETQGAGGTPPCS